MERPKSFHAKPKIDDGTTQPDCLTELLNQKGPVSIDMIAEAWVRDLPGDTKESLVRFLVEGPLDQVWRCNILHIDNFPSEDARGAYLYDVMMTYSDKSDAKELMAAHVRRDVIRYVINIVRGRILDALFRDANHNCGYGIAMALERVESGNSLEQQQALLTILKAFGEDFLADQSFPIISQRYLEHTRTNRKFKQECHSTLTTRFRKHGKVAKSDRQREVIWLALRPELARKHLNGGCTAMELKQVLLKFGVKEWDNESSKHFHQFVLRNFGDLKDKTSS